MNKNIVFLKFTLIAVFAVAWFQTKAFFYDFPDKLLQFDLLTFVSLFFTLFIIKKIKSNILLWIIFVWIFFAHFIQLYLIISLLLNSNPLLHLMGLLRGFLILPIETQANDLILIYQISVATLVGYSLAVLFINKYIPVPSTPKIKEEKSIINEAKTQLFQKKIDIKVIKKFVFPLIFISTLFLYAQNEVVLLNEQGIVLPFRLQGIIRYSNELIIPIAYAALIYFLEIYKSSSLANKIATIFVINSFLYSFTTTSRKPVPLSLFVLIMIWLFTKTLNKKRIIFLSLLILFIPVIIFIPTRIRFSSQLNIWNDFTIISQIFQEILSSIQSDEANLFKKYWFYPFTRLNGSCSSFPIFSSQILRYGPEYIWEKFAQVNYHTGQMMKIIVLNVPTTQKIGISMGFTSSMHLLSGGNNIFVSFSVFLYTIVWNLISNYFYIKSVYNRFAKIVVISLLSFYFLIDGNLIRMLNGIIFLFMFIWMSDRITKFIIGKKRQTHMP